MKDRDKIPFGQGIPGVTPIPKTEPPWNEEEEE